MKKAMWIISFIPLAVTAVILQYLPDSLPMHYDMAGNIDRFGNKTEQLIFPIIILAVTGFWNIMISYSEKKSGTANTEKEASNVASNVKLLCIVGISEAVMFGLMHFFILYGAYIEANTNARQSVFDIAKISCILGGILFIITGSFMSNIKKNKIAGVRTVWSMYNDKTWQKSNRFGAVSTIIVGILTILTAVFSNGNTGIVMMIAYLIISSAADIIYSKIVYEKERKINN